MLHLKRAAGGRRERGGEDRGNETEPWCVFLLLVATLPACGHLVDESEAIRAAETVGMTDVHITDHSAIFPALRGRDEHDAAAFDIQAKRCMLSSVAAPSSRRAPAGLTTPVPKWPGRRSLGGLSRTGAGTWEARISEGGLWATTYTSSQIQSHRAASA